MMKKTAQGLMVLAAMLWSTGGAQARDLFQNMQLDVFALGGGSTLVDARYFDSAGRLYHSRFDPGTRFTLGVSMPYRKYLSFETAYSYGLNNLVLSNTDVYPHVGTAYPVHVIMGSLSAVAHAPAVRFHFRPYAELGVEFDHFSPTPAAVKYAYDVGWATTNTALINRNDKLGISVGGGLDRKLTKRLAFRIDLRDHVTSSPGFGLPNSYNPGAAYSSKGRADNIVYTAGFVYHLGKM